MSTYNTKPFKEFLKLTNQHPDAKKREEINSYIIQIMIQSEESNEVLEFELLKDSSYFPNICIDNVGELFLNTRSMFELYNDYINGVQYVKTEVATLCRNKFLVLHEIATTSITTDRNEV